MNTIETTLPSVRDKRRNKRRGGPLSHAAWGTLGTAIRQLEETWRNAPQPVRPHALTSLGYLHTHLIAGDGSVIKMESIEPFENTPGVLLAMGRRKMSDESAGQGGVRSESQSALIDETCSRFETAWRAGQQPRIEDFLPAESPDKTEAAQRSLLVHLVGIDLEWRWKTAAAPGETLPVAPNSPRPYPGEGQGVRAFPLRPRLADYVTRYALLGPVEQLPCDLIVNEYYARSHYGDRPTHAEYLEAYGVNHPELAKQLQAIDQGMAAVEQIRTDLVAEDESPLGAAVQHFGEYDLLEKLGEGGMGVVYKAQHRRMKRFVAVKMIAKREIGSPDAEKRFYREVETAAKLNHSNIVQAYDASEHEGVHYLVMEYVEGKDLAVLVNESGTLPIAQAVDYVIQAARGLQYAHAQGIIHRDIKPSNLLLANLPSPRAPCTHGRGRGGGGEGVVKILDMGLARMAGLAGDSDRDRMTGSGQMMGTCDYMSPEQSLDAHHADARADIYSLGCTLYKLLTGHVLYMGESLMQILLAHRESPIPSLCQDRPDVPPQLDAVYRKMVAKQPEERYQSMTEVITALETCVGRSGATATSVGKDGTAAFPIADDPAFLQGAATGGTATAAKKKAQTRAETTLSQQAASAETSKLPGRRQLGAARKKKTPAVRIGLGLGVVGIIALSAILYVLTSKGTLEIETNDPDVEVAVKQNGKLVEVVDAKSGWKISLKSGEYELAMQGSTDQVQLDKDSVVVKRGDTVKVKVTLKRPSPISDSKSEISTFTSPLPAVGSLIGRDGKWKLPPGVRPQRSRPSTRRKRKRTKRPGLSTSACRLKSPTPSA